MENQETYYVLLAGVEVSYYFLVVTHLIQGVGRDIPSFLLTQQQFEKLFRK